MIAFVNDPERVRGGHPRGHFCRSRTQIPGSSAATGLVRKDNMGIVTYEYEVNVSYLAPSVRDFHRARGPNCTQYR